MLKKVGAGRGCAADVGRGRPRGRCRTRGWFSWAKFWHAPASGLCRSRRTTAWPRREFRELPGGAAPRVGCDGPGRVDRGDGGRPYLEGARRPSFWRRKRCAVTVHQLYRRAGKPTRMCSSAPTGASSCAGGGANRAHDFPERVKFQRVTATEQYPRRCTRVASFVVEQAGPTPARLPMSTAIAWTSFIRSSPSWPTAQGLAAHGYPRGGRRNDRGRV